MVERMEVNGVNNYMVEQPKPNPELQEILEEISQEKETTPTWNGVSIAVSKTNKPVIYDFLMKQANNNRRVARKLAYKMLEFAYRKMNGE